MSKEAPNPNSAIAGLSEQPTAARSISRKRRQTSWDLILGFSLVIGPWSLGLLFLLLTSCAVGPNYKRPAVNAPPTFRGQAEVTTNSFADLPWWQVFHDDALQSLIRTALTNNYDLKIAVTRVEQARAIVAEARAGLFPQIGYGASPAGAKM